MEELVLTIEKTNIEYGLKTVLDIDQLRVYQNERIGIIGDNGSGKSTLLKAIVGEMLVGKGKITRQIEFSYLEQICLNEQKIIDENAELFSKLGVPSNSYKEMSGGEQAKYRLATMLSNYHEGMILDEPTTHLDEHSIQFLIDELRFYYGTLIFVSHDRYFLNELATKIWEISGGKITEYHGNYESYKKQKEQENIEQQRTYQQVENEKKRLEKAIVEREKQAQKLIINSKKKSQKQKKPSRLSGTKQKDSVQKSIQKNVKTMEKRLSKLDSVSEINRQSSISFPIHQFKELHNPYPIRGEAVTISQGKCLLDKTDFQFEKGKKIAIVGSNGVGKTSFLKAILDGNRGIITSSKAIISTFYQQSYQENHESSVLSYLIKQSNYEEKIVRSILNKLGFTQEELQTSFNQLSGGERTRVGLALTMLRPSNVLILDEPTNFIDLKTIEALEDLIRNYPGMVIVVSHDRYFVNQVADQIYEIKDKQLIRISG